MKTLPRIIYGIITASIIVVVLLYEDSLRVIPGSFFMILFGLPIILVFVAYHIFNNPIWAVILTFVMASTIGWLIAYNWPRSAVKITDPEASTFWLLYATLFIGTGIIALLLIDGFIVIKKKLMRNG